MISFQQLIRKTCLNTLISILLVLVVSSAITPNCYALSDDHNKKSDPNDSLLDMKIDFSSINNETTFEEAVELMRKAVKGSASIVVQWKVLEQDAFIAPEDLIGIDGIEKKSLKGGLELILKALGGELAELAYVHEDGVIFISTRDELNVFSMTMDSDKSCEKQLDTKIDFSFINHQMTFKEIVDNLRSQNIPDLTLVVSWKNISKGPLGIDYLGEMTLRTGLGIILGSIGRSSSEFVYSCKDGLIAIKEKPVYSNITILGVDKKSIPQSPKAKKKNEKLLDTQVDFSAIGRDTTFVEAIELIRSQSSPPLPITVLWNELLENARVEPGKPVRIDGFGVTTLRAGLELILESVSHCLIYCCNDGKISVEIDPSRNYRAFENENWAFKNKDWPLSVKYEDQYRIYLVFDQSSVYFLNKRLNGGVEAIPEALKKIEEPEKTTLSICFTDESNLKRTFLTRVVKNILIWAEQSGLEDVGYEEPGIPGRIQAGLIIDKLWNALCTGNAEILTSDDFLGHFPNVYSWYGTEMVRFSKTGEGQYRAAVLCEFKGLCFYRVFNLVGKSGSLKFDIDLDHEFKMMRNARSMSVEEYGKKLVDEKIALWKNAGDEELAKLKNEAIQGLVDILLIRIFAENQDNDDFELAGPAGGLDAAKQLVELIEKAETKTPQEVRDLFIKEFRSINEPNSVDEVPVDQKK